MQQPVPQGIMSYKEKWFHSTSIVFISNFCCILGILIKVRIFFSCTALKNSTLTWLRYKEKITLADFGGKYCKCMINACVRITYFILLFDENNLRFANCIHCKIFLPVIS